MPGKNGYAALVKQRAEGRTKRRKLDDYETPPDVTQRLLRHVKFKGPILEPACGSGRMVKVLREHGRKTIGGDIKHGVDFFKRTQTWRGDIVTNPPYRDGLAERFVWHALKIADGRVCMLMEGKFIWGDKRAANLYAHIPPDLIIVIPDRVYFYAGGKPIPSQFFNHAWLCWPIRAIRQAGGYHTRTVWVRKEEEF